MDKGKMELIRIGADDTEELWKTKYIDVDGLECPKIKERPVAKISRTKTRRKSY